MKKFLFYTLCVMLFKTSTQESSLFVNNSHKFNDNYINLKAMEKRINLAIQYKKDLPTSTKKLQILQKYLKNKIRKHKKRQEILHKITKEDISLSHICKQEFLKSLAHKKNY